MIAEKQKERDAINKRIDELSKLRKKELDARDDAATRRARRMASTSPPRRRCASR